MTELHAGQLDHRVTVQKRKATYGTRGESLEEWTDEQSRWAEVVHLRGRELEQARQIVETATTRITIRKPRNYDMTASYRVCFRGEVFNVESATPTGDRLEDMELICGRVIR